ncbi:MAG: winged helix-turn-helix transcriptional regulator [Phycisphaerales bacterium JB043]
MSTERIDENSESSTHRHTGCHFVDIMEVVGGKWRGTIIYCLMSRSMRFNELRGEIGTISSKVLTTELRSLERDGLLERVSADGVSGHALYGLSSLGHALVRVFERVESWMEEVLPEIYRSRELYDRQNHS